MVLMGKVGGTGSSTMTKALAFNIAERLIFKGEIAQAQALGVAIHTVFIGYSSCPPVLDTLSMRSGGSRFAAYFDVDTKSIQVIDRDTVSLQDLYADSGKDHELRMLDRMTRMPTVFQRFLDENNLVV